MPTVKLIEEDEASPQVAAIYADIKTTFGLPFVPSLFKAMAHYPAYLEATWNRYKAIMLSGQLDRRTKEIVARHESFRSVRM